MINDLKVRDKLVHINFEKLKGGIRNKRWL
jgi:hypothetical protein